MVDNSAKSTFGAVLDVFGDRSLSHLLESPSIPLTFGNSPLTPRREEEILQVVQEVEKQSEDQASPCFGSGSAAERKVFVSSTKRLSSKRPLESEPFGRVGFTKKVSFLFQKASQTNLVSRPLRWGDLSEKRERSASKCTKGPFRTTHRRRLQ